MENFRRGQEDVPGSGQRAGAPPCGPQSVWTLPRDAFSACLAESPDASLS